MKKEAKTGSQRQAEYRAKKIEQGLIQVTLWVDERDRDNLVNTANDMLKRREPKETA